MSEIKIILENAIWNLTNRLGIIDIIDILIFAFIIYNLFLIIKQTRATQLMTGAVLIILISIASNMLGLKSIGWLVNTLISNGVIVFVILFSHEIRKVLEQLGLVAFRDNARRSYANSEEEIVEHIVEASINLSKTKTGALIVFQQNMKLDDILKTGTIIDASISSQIIQNLFYPKSPLHDGAVIIDGSKIIAAGCVLSLSDNNNISKELGTRHRAALGITETSDAVSLIVSEETGTISMASKGVLIRHLSKEQLVKRLSELYKSPEQNSNLKNKLIKLIKGN